MDTEASEGESCEYIIVLYSGSQLKAFVNA